MRNKLLTLLEQWQSGTIDEREVHWQAEEWLEQLSDEPNYPEHDPRSIPMEVLVELDTLNHQLLTKDDIPAMVEFLHTPPSEELQGWARWQRYNDELDLESRKKELKNNPYYST